MTLGVVVAFAIAIVWTAFGAVAVRVSMSGNRTYMSELRTTRRLLGSAARRPMQRSSCSAGLRRPRHVADAADRCSPCAHEFTLVANQPLSPVPEHRDVSGRIPGPSPPRTNHRCCSRAEGQLPIIQTATKIQQRPRHRLIARKRNGRRTTLRLWGHLLHGTPPADARDAA
jgi:hypothetical protein